MALIFRKKNKVLSTWSNLWSRAWSTASSWDRRVLIAVVVGFLVGAMAATGYFYRINPGFIASSQSAKALADEDAVRQQIKADCEAFTGPRVVNITDLKIIRSVAGATVDCSNPANVGGPLDYVALKKASGLWVVVYRGDKIPAEEDAQRMGLPVKDIFPSN